MVDAITPLPPQAVALIKEGTPRPQTPSPTISAIPAVSTTTPTGPAKPAAEPVAAAKPKATKPASEDAGVLVPLTFRVPKGLPQVLLSASVDRKLKKIKPYTQQDIVTEALSDWFQKHGYQL
jgi:hypothetical protein